MLNIQEKYFYGIYTGHCPAYKEIIGQSFGRATHDLIEALPSLPGRLKLSTLEKEKAPDEDDLDILQKRKSEVKSVLSKDITPGYQGHVPRVREMIGLNFNQSCIRGVAEFEKKNKLHEEYLKVAEIKNGG
ncbi:uncharacterized protein TNCT_136231 [Trichonephila clavata]|uniref:Uncharacterized protein n=1 Tax=Trichonephila clavata TaxID=2740835 RepID=A0A8X6HR60_TRICU|nr:uncharacterized protein TNCT_136231 [Trichonephila clavata]